MNISHITRFDLFFIGYKIISLVYNYFQFSLVGCSGVVTKEKLLNYIAERRRVNLLAGASVTKGVEKDNFDAGWCQIY